MNPPERPARAMEIILRRLEGFGGGGVGDPAAADRLDYRQRFQRVRGVAQPLMGAMKLLALLLGELRWLTTQFHVVPPESGVTHASPTVAQQSSIAGDQARPRRGGPGTSLLWRNQLIVCEHGGTMRGVAGSGAATGTPRCI